MTCEGLGQRLRNLENPQTTVPPQPRLVVTGFTCDPAAVIGQLVVADRVESRRVNVVTSNAVAEIPQGVFGLIYSKESATSCSVLIRGLASGFSNLMPGMPLFCGTTGGFSTTAPVTGMSQKLATAISTTEIIYDPHTPLRRAN